MSSALLALSPVAGAVVAVGEVVSAVIDDATGVTVVSATGAAVVLDASDDEPLDCGW